MAVQLRHARDDLAVSHEINVTPFIDVVLVLLIIFMVAAPLATVDVAVDLPASTAARQPRPDKPIFLSIKADHSLVLDNTTVDAKSLTSALDKLSTGDKSQRIFLQADRTVDYGQLMAVMNDLRAAGYLKVALVGLESTKGP